ncbi:HlyD family secretion protein [Croceimicrobium hydrocarbonivorans]|uniref:HlyD family efflux transporter periplasmic adaptor subunit n=1 Tax=Croceimicrobium hydrocarbonivorans TaxID=2761580 RepID=A0A7H0VIV9_9FLAO|nr:HlyD family efflux transporter periplasmic adaptor subunit [Croceimicrobium hydrocarbonivorans]QNR25657.1 HlyD family efflux transporter periplasmic adaptor subunit [Croceimicrobium hydrocarbonivorans]
MEEVKDQIQKEKKSSLEEQALRSFVVNDIINKPPHWLLRWGVTSVFIVIILVLLASWFVRYPDIISGMATVKAENPVVLKSSLVNGRLNKLFVVDGQKVQKGDALLSFENPMSADEYSYLQSFLIQFDSISNKSDLAQNLILDIDTNRNFGLLQASFNRLSSAYLAIQELNSRSIDSMRLLNLKEQISNYENLVSIAETQVRIARNELRNAEQKHKADKKLFKEGVYSKVDFMDMESAYRGKLSALENAKQTKGQYKVTTADYKRQLSELEYELQKERRELLIELNQALATLKSEMTNWEQSNIILANTDGTINYLVDLFEGRTVLAGEPLLAIIPEDQQYYVSAFIPPSNYGKVQIGQEANLKLDNYNWQEFGILKGKVKTVSELPTEEGYRVVVEVLNYPEVKAAHKLELRPEMNGMLEIKTNDLRLIERFFHNLKKIFERKPIKKDEEKDEK